MKEVRNIHGTLLATCRDLKVTHSQLLRLIDDYDIESVPLVLEGVQTVFQVDLDELRDFTAYYSDFIFHVEFTRGINKDYVRLDIDGTEEIKPN